MTFDVTERSNFLGVPVGLYEFNIGTSFWRYTSHEEPVTIGGHTYEPSAVSDSGVVQSGNAENSEVSITMPSDETVALLFNTTPPSDEMFVTIRRMHHGEDGAPVFWVGTVTNTKQSGQRATQFTCQALTATFNRNGLRLSWGRQCPHAVYDFNCRVNKAGSGVFMVAEVISGNAIEAAAFATYPDTHFDNGFFEFVMIEGAVERRAIEYHVGNTVTILGATDGMDEITGIVAYPGCNRSADHCKNKFFNLPNYGGFPHLPGKSPFNGDPIF